MIHFDNKQDRQYLQRCYQLAQEAKKEDCVPVAAVLLFPDGSSIEAKNSRHTDNNPSHHAEYKVLMNAVKEHNAKLSKAVLYVNLEPCFMCYALLKEARISKLVFSIKNKRKKGFESLLWESNTCYHLQIPYRSAYLKDENAALLKSFFEPKRSLSVKGN